MFITRESDYAMLEEAMETGVLQAKTEEIQRTCAVWISKVVCNQWNRVFLLSK